MDPRSLALTLAIALLVPAAAGCLGGSDADGSTGPADAGDGGDDVTSQGPQEADDGNGTGPPDWQVGDWFEYERSGPWTVEGTSRLVVTEATDDGYVTGLTDRDQERIDIYWSNDPLLGSLDRDLNADLASEPDPPAVLDWPLTDGRTWTTEGYGIGPGWTWSFNATRVDAVETPAGPRAGYRIVGESPMNMTVEGAYVPSIGSLTSYRVTWEGSFVFGYELTGFGEAHGDGVWTASRTVHVPGATYTSEDLVPPVVEFSVAAEATDLVVSVVQSSATVSATSLLDPDGGTRYQAVSVSQDPTTTTGTSGSAAFQDPAEGTWRWVLATVASGTDPASCGPDPPRSALCGGIFLRTATLQMEEIVVG